MQRMTFRGFLTRYTKELSYENSNNLYRLVREAASQNARLREPLFLYAVWTDKLPVLLSSAKNTPLDHYYLELSRRFDRDSLMYALSNSDSALPNEFHKVWKSYQSVAQKYERDVRVKRLIRSKVLMLQEEKNISTYRVCKTLKLNNSNVNAWLKNDFPEKVGLETARSILDYVQAQN